MAEICEWCGKVYYTKEDVPSKQYMRVGHIIMECEEVPPDTRDFYNEPQLP